jgi:predicted ester cyclase
VDAKQFIVDEIAVFESGDVDGVCSMFAEEVRGRAGVREVCEALYGAFADIRLENTRLIAEGHSVVGQFDIVATHAGPALGHAPTGRRIRFRACSVFDLNETNDQIVRETYYHDAIGLAAQLAGRA